MTDLIERLRAHADAHANVSPYDGEQAQWEADLREAAATLDAARELRDAADRCYRMLLSEPDTKAALFTAENVLREAVVGFDQARGKGVAE